MAVRINLLPYRQLRREKRQKEFQLLFAGALIGAALVVLLGNNIISNRIENQQERNQRLQNAIAQLDREIAEIKELKNRISDVLDRKRVIEELQSGRSRAVVLLDELARQLPEGIYLKSVDQQGDVVTLQGIADTDARVATLIRNVASSPVLEAPELVQISAVTENNLKRSAFTLKLTQRAQQPDAAQDAASGGQTR